MATDMILEIDMALQTAGSFGQKEAFLAGVETGLNAGQIYIENGFKNSSFISAYLTSNIDAILFDSDSFPYGHAQNSTSLQWALGAGFGSLFPESKIVRGFLMNEHNLKRLGYLQGLKLAFETLFEIKEALGSRNLDTGPAIEEYLARVRAHVSAIEY